MNCPRWEETNIAEDDLKRLIEELSEEFDLFTLEDNFCELFLYNLEEDDKTDTSNTPSVTGEVVAE